MYIPETTKTKIRKLLTDNKKLDAVKLARQELNLGLKDALHLAEAIQAGEDIRLNTFQKSPFSSGRFGNSDTAFSLFTKIFLGIGILLWAIAGVLAYNTENNIADSQQVPGTVVDFETGSGYIPIVAYTYNNERRQVRGTVSSSPPAYELGEQVGVLISNSPSKPVLINSITELWFAPIILGFIGLVFLFIGGVARAVSR